MNSYVSEINMLFLVRHALGFSLDRTTLQIKHLKHNHFKIKIAMRIFNDY